LMLSKRHQSDDLVYSSNLKVHFFCVQSTCFSWGALNFQMKTRFVQCACL
jgi:hypothetical protein